MWIGCKVTRFDCHITTRGSFTTAVVKNISTPTISNVKFKRLFLIGMMTLTPEGYENDNAQAISCMRNIPCYLVSNDKFR